MVRDINLFGLRRYLREYGNFKTCAVIFIGDGLGNSSKGIVDRMIFSKYLRIFEDYRVDLLKQFTDTNQLIHGF